VKISKQAKRDAKQLFNTCKMDGLIDDGRIRQSLQAVISRKPRGYVAILSHFHRLVKLDLERRAARVESAVALTPDQQATVQQNLTRRYGQGLNIAFAQNPDLIGGLRIKVGSDLIDGSVQNRIAALAESF
jgi:F-type H+-transporting ATPase subunit delta